MPTKSRRRRLSTAESLKGVVRTIDENTSGGNSPIAPSRNRFTINDDSAERKKRRQSRSTIMAHGSPLSRIAGESDRSRRAAAASRRRRRSSVGGVKNVQIPTGAELDELYNECISLSSHNKINSKNAWSLKLMDYLPEMLEKQQNAENSAGIMNFQAASCTLDASVKIYSGRVDSVHSDAYKVLGGLSRSSANASKAADDATEQEDGDGASSTKRKSRSTCVTLVPEGEQGSILAGELSDLMFSVDPLFQKTSATFDAGGASGVLLNQLRLGTGCEVVFSGGDTTPARASFDEALAAQQQDEEAPVDPTQSCDNAVDWDVSCVVQMMEDGGDKLSSASLCPTFTGYRLHDPSFKPNLMGLEAPEDGRGAEHHEEEQHEAIEFDWEADDIDMDGGGGMGDFLSLGEAIPFTGLPGAGGDMDATGMVALAGAQGGQTALVAAKSIALSLPFAFRGSSWAGPSHWKFRASPGDSSGVRASKSRKAKFFIDFSEPPVNPDEAFTHSRAATTLTQTTRNKHTEEANTLPEDIHYDAKRLVQLFLKPDLGVLQRGGTGGYSTAMAGDGATEQSASFAPGEEDDGGFGGFDYDDYAVDDGDAVDGGSWDVGDDEGRDVALLRAPRTVQQVNIQYAKVAKRVDVKALKNVLWDELKSDSDDAPVEEQEGALSFQDTIWKMSDKIDSKPNLQQASVPFCFICLLHLANEKSLSLEQSDLTDLAVAF